MASAWIRRGVIAKVIARVRHHPPMRVAPLIRAASLGGEVGEVLQRVVKVVRPERRELEAFPHLGRDR